MTVEEFDNQLWSAGMKASWNGTTWDVANCDFEEKKVGLSPMNNDLAEEIGIIEVPCIQVTIIKE